MISRNPFTGEQLGSYPELSPDSISLAISKSHQAFINWRNSSLTVKTQLFASLAGVMDAKKRFLAELITSEMGKPIRESVSEIEKCIWLCRHHADQANFDLAPIVVKTEAKLSQVSFEPTGIIFAIMPWNFPFWQVLRFAVPNIMAGNVALLKHAPNVTGCGLALEQLFIEAGFAPGIFTTIVIDHLDSEIVIASPFVTGVTLTGSAKAGSAVASLAGKHIKKCVLELGGSDPFVVFPDADIETSCVAATRSRLLNAGQVCIAAKRFIVHEDIIDAFIALQLEKFEQLRPGNPLDPQTEIGPMARPDLTDQIERQVNESIRMGAKLICGGKRSSSNREIYLPTLLTNVDKGMPVYDEETFGPVAIIIPFRSKEEAIMRMNDTAYGLGASIWTSDEALAEEVASRAQAGAVFVNSMTKSDPRLPFGGVKKSGFGRELHSIGMKEFMNTKTTWIES
ncbi:MAG: NAD-dependent succinate-semialdehyde dehydrogenase [Bacteroidetes bacterium]|nr:NAD-dependent succinate-semialdehyde dehydrogenase [Bacteroidota bacterium]